VRAAAAQRATRQPSRRPPHHPLLPLARNRSNTYGGCNAAAAAGLATLAEVKRLNLQAHAAAVGAHLLARLRALQAAHPDVVGDVRGRGLFLGVDIVRDPESKVWGEGALGVGWGY
jgi:4-aminobutyrate aminotransferase-like enzyme